MLQERGLWKESIQKQCGAVSKEDTETDAEFNVKSWIGVKGEKIATQ